MLRQAIECVGQNVSICPAEGTLPLLKRPRTLFLGLFNSALELIKHQPIWLYETTQHESERLENLTIILYNNNCDITLSKRIVNFM